MKPVSFFRHSWRRKDAKTSPLSSSSNFPTTSDDAPAKSFFDVDEEPSDPRSAGLRHRLTPRRPRPPSETLPLYHPSREIERTSTPLVDAGNIATDARPTHLSEEYSQHTQRLEGRPGDGRHLRPRLDHYATTSLPFDYSGILPGRSEGLDHGDIPFSPFPRAAGGGPASRTLKAERSMPELTARRYDVEEVRHDLDSLASDKAGSDPKAQIRRRIVDRSKKQSIPRRHHSETLPLAYLREECEDDPFGDPVVKPSLLENHTRSTGIVPVLVPEESPSLPCIQEGSDSSCSTVTASRASASSCIESDECPFPLSLFPAPPSLKIDVDRPIPHSNSSVTLSPGPPTPDSSPLWTPTSPKYILDLKKSTPHPGAIPNAATHSVRGLRSIASTSSLSSTKSHMASRSHRATVSNLSHEQSSHLPPGLGHAAGRMASTSGPELSAPHSGQVGIAAPSPFRHITDNSEVAVKEATVVEWGYAV